MQNTQETDIKKAHWNNDLIMRKYTENEELEWLSKNTTIIKEKRIDKHNNFKYH